MALTFADFIRDTDPNHNGRLTLSMFPKWDQARLEAFLTAQIARAYAHPDVDALPDAGNPSKDDAAEAFVYWQAFDTAVLEVTFAAQQADVDRVASITHDRLSLIHI